jgi:hypothetical protein
MQPYPIAETCNPPVPSVRFFIWPLVLPTEVRVFAGARRE